jgi:hypothetical protein
MLGIPTVDDVRAWTGASSTRFTDDDLSSMLNAELLIQARELYIPDDPDPDTGSEAVYPDPLVRSLLRRVQRQVAVSNAPLGLVGGDATEWAPVGVRRFDPEIERLETSYARAVIA